jgi:DNA-binding NarL/FixJ family response regulator
VKTHCCGFCLAVLENLYGYPYKAEMIHVFLVDDHPILRDGLRMLLTSEGLSVVGEAGDVTTAVVEISRRRPEVVVLDLSLGDRSGIEVLTGLAKRGLHPRTLVLTMYDQPRLLREAFDAGVLGYVLKGAEAVEIIAAVRQVAAGQRFLGTGLGPRAVEGLLSPKSADPVAELSDRERQVLRLVLMGRSSKSIAHELNLSAKTIDTYRSRLMQKLGVHDVVDLMRFAARHHLLEEARL